MNVRDYIPNVNFKITTSLSEAEVITRLSENSEKNLANSLFFNIYPDVPFLGKVSGRHFRLMRIVREGKPTVRGFIKGNITAAAGQTVLDVKMKPLLLPLIAWVAFCLIIVCYPLFVFGSLFFNTSHSFDLRILLLLVFIFPPFAIHIGLMNIFERNVSETKDIFKAILKDHSDFKCDDVPIF